MLEGLYFEYLWKNIEYKQTSVVFCKYLRNKSLDLHEILFGDHILSFELKFQISRRSMHKCAHTSCKCARARFIASTRVYESCARICSPIIMKFITLVHKIVIDHHIKFHKDPSFCWGDICKTIFTFLKHKFSMYFPYFHSFAPQKSYKVDNYWMVMEVFGN